MLIVSVRSIETSVDSLLEVAGKVGANTANIPQLRATAPVLEQIVTEAVVQDGYMNAHRRIRRPMSTRDVLVLLTVVLAAVVVAVLALALIEVRRRLTRISAGLATLSALQQVEAEHLRPLEGAVQAINGQFEVILSALPGIASKAAIVAERRPRRSCGSATSSYSPSCCPWSSTCSEGCSTLRRGSSPARSRSPRRRPRARPRRCRAAGDDAGSGTADDRRRGELRRLAQRDPRRHAGGGAMTPLLAIQAAEVTISSSSA